MSFTRNLLPALMFSTALVMPFAAGAFEASDVEARLKAQFSGQGMEVKWASAEASGEDVVLKGVTINPPGETPLAIGDATLADITEEDDDILRIGSLTLPDFAHEADGKSLNVTGFVMEGLSLPGAATTDEIAKLGFAETFGVDSVTVAEGGKTVFTLSNVGGESEITDDGSFTFSGGIEAFSADMTTLPDPKAKEAMAAFGMEKLEGALTLEGAWNPKDGNFKMETYEVTVDKAGTLSMASEIGGYTLSLVKQLQEMNMKMATATEEEKGMQGMMMLGMMQTLIFNSASMRFDDDGLTANGLAYAAKQQGMTPEDIKNQAKAMLPFMLAQLENADLTAQVSAAVAKFLDDPKSLEITAKPATPQPFAALMAAGMSAPKTIPALLGVTVTANE